MLQLRARAFALRDIFPDALMGLAIAEEIRDITPAEPFNPPPIKTLPAYPQEQLQSHLSGWQTAIENGKSAESIIGMVSSKYQLTEAQKTQIRALAVKEEGEEENSHEQV
ncbi:hypothetical protein AXE65_12740 [Ventosimonas gracilis]|uniref:Uncharacterized protein n=1 Tax=Ventosimonas gracilis TaxID=1680762 RepID=A0A139SW28_9GAMM|nr:hypothetical protein AXE65_12740 [Ventosimonas gracilis]